MPNPLVSVIIPAYNAELFINEAIKSVLHQTYKPIEIIVIDDGSNDSTKKVVQQFGQMVKLIHQPNEGISSARNAGLQIARGSFIAFLDADDVWLPTKLEKQMAYLEINPQKDIVFCLAQNTYKPDLLHISNDRQFPIIEGHTPPTCLLRKKVIADVGLFDTSIKLGEFADWYARALNKKIAIGSVNSLLVLRRIHGNNIGIKHKTEMTQYLHILKRKIDAAKIGEILAS